MTRRRTRDDPDDPILAEAEQIVRAHHKQLRREWTGAGGRRERIADLGAQAMTLAFLIAMFLVLAAAIAWSFWRAYLASGGL